MACSKLGKTDGSLHRLLECPACQDYYKLPRLLKCGHQFCEECLVEIVKRPPDGEIPCPTCHDVTEPSGGDVTTLPRSKLSQYMQELIFHVSQKEVVGQTCSKCNLYKPTRHCPDCQPELSFMCDDCFEKHQMVPSFAKHACVRFNPLLVCPEHPHKMVECYCHQCCVMVCGECIFQSHGDHGKDVENMEAAADKGKLALTDFIHQQRMNAVDPIIIELLKNDASQLLKTREEFKTKKIKLQGLMEALNTKLEENYAKLNQAADLEFDKMSKSRAQLCEVIEDQDKIQKIAQCLLTNHATDPLVILGSRKLPNPGTNLTEIPTTLPTIDSDVYDKMADDLQNMLKNAEVGAKGRVHRIQTGKWDLKPTASIPTPHSVKGITFDTNNKQIILSTNDPDGPIKMYSLEGEFKFDLGGFTSRGKKPEGSWYRQMTIDSRRDLFVITCSNHMIAFIKFDGEVKTKDLLKGDLRGVAYLSEVDRYVVTDCDKDNPRVILVCPETLTVTQTLGGAKVFTQPTWVSVGSVSGTTTIVVSDEGKRNLLLFNINGDLLQTYDSTFLASIPKGVSVDRRGRVFICLAKAKPAQPPPRGFNLFRPKETVDDVIGDVLWCIWSGQYDDVHRKCVLESDVLGGSPEHVAIDNENRYMAVSVGDSLKLYTF